MILNTAAALAAANRKAWKAYSGVYAAAATMIDSMANAANASIDPPSPNVMPLVEYAMGQPWIWGGDCGCPGDELQCRGALFLDSGQSSRRDGSSIGFVTTDLHGLHSNVCNSGRPPNRGVT